MRYVLNMKVLFVYLCNLFKGGMNFDNVLVNEDGATAGCMNYRPVVDPFNKHSTPVKVQLTRLTGEYCICVLVCPFSLSAYT